MELTVSKCTRDFITRIARVGVPADVNGRVKGWLVAQISQDPDPARSLLLGGLKSTLSPSARVVARSEIMRQTQINDPFHNPFHNRFHVPVHSRLDEMQAYTHMVWLNTPAPLPEEKDLNEHQRHWGRALAGAFALVLVVVFSAALLSR